MATKQDQPLNEWNTKPQKVNVSLGESRTTPQLEGFRATERLNNSYSEFVKKADPEKFKSFTPDSLPISAEIKAEIERQKNTPPSPPEASRKELSPEELLKRISLVESEKEKAYQTVEWMEATRSFLPPKQEKSAENAATEPAQESATKEKEPRPDEERRRLLAQQQEAAQRLLEERFIHTKDGKYYPRDDSKHLSFTDSGNTLKTKEVDHYTATSMVLAAQAKGWDAIKVNGTKEFKSMVWLEAASRGIEVKGYKPTEKDLALLAERQARDAKNTIEHTERTSSIPTDTATEKSANRKAIDAVTDSILRSRVTDPQKRETLRKEIGRKLDIYEKHGGNMPTLKAYDSKARKTAQDRIPVQRGERTR